MTSDHDQIQVGYDNLETAASDAEGTAKQIGKQLDDLKTYLAELGVTWQGQASIAYQERQRQWDESAAVLNQVLHNIAATLRNSNESYQSAENQNRNLFEG